MMRRTELSSAVTLIANHSIFLNTHDAVEIDLPNSDEEICSPTVCARTFAHRIIQPGAASADPQLITGNETGRCADERRCAILSVAME